MNKNDLVAAVSDATSLSKSDAAKAVESVFDTITSTLTKGEEIRLVGFGTFSVARRAASEGRNPRTGESVQVPEKFIPYFKTGKQIRDKLNSGS